MNIQPVHTSIKLEKIKTNPITYKLKDVPIDSIVVWEEAQARTLDVTDIDSLAKSIHQEGLQNPLMVQKNGASSYLLMAGQRRLAALKKLEIKTAPVLVLDTDSVCDVADAKAVSIIENIHRKDMNAGQMASSCQFLVKKLGKQETAKALGIDSRTLRQYLGFDAVPDTIKSMTPKLVSKSNAIKICQIIPSESRALEIIDKISKLDMSQKKRYLDALEQAGQNATHSEISKLANSFRARQNLSLKISKLHAKKLAKISRDNDMEPAEMAQKVLSDYLSKK